jgi:1,4-dihydroxy-2-naphthoate octaprenyltransferase
MPVFFFALSFVKDINWFTTFFSFFIIHFLVYPSSNGYNSYMDRDIDSIGGVEKPMQPTKELFYTTVVMDVSAITLSLLISLMFASAITIYILCSKMYSYRGIRLKRFPVIGYFTVILNQGTLIFATVYKATEADKFSAIPYIGLIAAAFLIGGFYPITQVYQHKADKEDNVNTISMLLGKRGTFIFCGIMYAIAFSLLFFHYKEINAIYSFLVLQIFFVPVIFYFIKWFAGVWKNEDLANFKNTMRMNVIASTCTNLAFITLIILNRLG